MDIGIKLKSMRLQNALTQEELADRCELTKGYISQLENNLTSPSIATLVDILGALGSDLKKFFNEEQDTQIVYSQEDFFIKEESDQSITWLVNNSQKNEMEPVILTLSPHAKTFEDMPHEGEEFGYVLDGSATLVLGSKEFKINTGNSFYYEANKKHYIYNDTDADVKIIWVSTPPTF